MMCSKNLRMGERVLARVVAEPHPPFSEIMHLVEKGAGGLPVSMEDGLVVVCGFLRLSVGNLLGNELLLTRGRRLNLSWPKYVYNVSVSVIIFVRLLTVSEDTICLMPGKYKCKRRQVLAFAVRACSVMLPRLKGRICAATVLPCSCVLPAGAERCSSDCDDKSLVTMHRLFSLSKHSFTKLSCFLLTASLTSGNSKPSFGESAYESCVVVADGVPRETLDKTIR